MTTSHRGDGSLSSPSTRKHKPGPKPFTPTDGQRREVELAVAVGMTVQEIADAIDMPKRTVERAFTCEIAAGRAKRLLASVVRLDGMAEAGNVSAAKFLHGLMARQPDEDDPEVNEWSHLENNLAENGEFRRDN
jgi:hypothetical protein